MNNVQATVKFFFCLELAFRSLILNQLDSKLDCFNGLCVDSDCTADECSNGAGKIYEYVFFFAKK